jgi:glucose/mannose transport system substrate-binding protein
MAMTVTKFLLTACLALVLAGPELANAEDLEVLHYWTAGGESKAVNLLKQDIEKQGFVWKDSAVAGGGGGNAMTVLKARVISGKPPVAVQMRGPAIQDWAQQGVMVPLDAVAGTWSKDLPPAISNVLMYQGHYYAAPHWVHRVNWMYINKSALDKVGGKPPKTWAQWFELADRLKAAGYIPIAHGGTPYQENILFENIVLSQGADFFKKAILERDQTALKSQKMSEVFGTLRRAQTYFDPGIQGRSWNQAAAMVIENKAVFLFMGDWAKGEFLNAKKVAGKDYLCVPDPGTAGSYTFIADGFAFFKQKGQSGATKGQLALASTIMSPTYQQEGPFYKGAIPARLGVPVTNYDECAKASQADMNSATKTDTLVPSMNQGTPESTLGAMRDVVTRFINSKQEVGAAVEALAKAAKTE